MKVLLIRKLLLIFLLIVIIFSDISAQSLKETVELALESNPLILAGKSKVEESRLDVKSTRLSTLPKIEFDASYRHVSDVMHLNFSKFNPMMPDKNVNFGVYDTYETGITANYLLFSGFAQKNLIEIKNQTAALENQQLAKTKKSIALQVIVKYRQAQNHQLEVEALNAASKRIDLQIKRINALVRQGMALSLDTLSLTLSKLNNDQKIIAAQASLETAIQELVALAGRDIKIESDANGIGEYNISGFEVKMNDDLQILKTSKNIIQSGKAVTESAYYPKVGLFAGIKYAKPGVNFIDNEWMTYGIWGVNLQWNLFSWGADHFKAQSQEAAVHTVDFQYQNYSNQLKTKYDAAVRQYWALKKQNAVAESARNLARRKMKIIQSRYNEGMSSVMDFNEANLELTDADINLQRQFILLAIKMSEIDYLSGKSINQWSIVQ